MVVAPDKRGSPTSTPPVSQIGEPHEVQLQAAQYQLWSAPQECTPALLTPLADASYRAMTALASVISCLAAADVDTTRRAALEHSRADFEVALAALRDALGERA
jgi:hypothetical protein